jgi:hypothetical protein
MIPYASTPAGFPGPSSPGQAVLATLTTAAIIQLRCSEGVAPFASYALSQAVCFEDLHGPGGSVHPAAMILDQTSDGAQLGPRGTRRT